MTKRIAVLASGSGSNLQAVLDACAHGRLAANVELVVSNDVTAYALHRATVAGVPGMVVERLPGEPRSGYDARLADVVAAVDPHVVVLAGWMRLLSSVFLDRFSGRVINLHPALPGELPGLRAIERAFAQASAGERRATGVMVHLVPDEGVDDGPVLASVTVPIHNDDTIDTLSARIHRAEHVLLVDAIASFLTCTSPVSES